MTATFLSHGNAIGKAAINVQIELKVVPASNGYNVGIQLGTPDVHADVLDDIPNQTELSNADLGTAVKANLDGMVASVSALLGSIPVPSVAGLSLHDLSIGSDSGYVMVKGTLQ
jgi:hypothetical protein